MIATDRSSTAGHGRFAAAHALADNPLRTRDDLLRAASTLCAALEPHRSAGGARIGVSGPRATYDDTVQEMEGFARQLWGLGPLLAGGGACAAAARVREGLINGCDPHHPDYWGVAGDRDQRLVELAAIAFAIAINTETFWTPLSASERQRVAAYLWVINEREVHDNNWRFFRVIVNLSLARCGAPFSRAQLAADLARIDAFYLGDGWYDDGCNLAVDYYGAFGMHFYGLICATWLRDFDRDRAGVLVERATLFAQAFIHWFSDDGAAIPYGRSLIYRCAQAAFWGALAYAEVEAVPWGVGKGLLLRHLRWWARQPILSDGGVLSIGYAYANQTVADRYSSPCSPYWALKSFLPAALPADAPFWRAIEQPLPMLDRVQAQPRSGMILCRDGDHVFALAGAARVPPRVRHAAAKYGKFCYSSRFGFSLPIAPDTLQSAAHDSALAFAEPDDCAYRARRESEAVDVSAARIVSHWRAWPDVTVTTWLVPIPPWHVRVHRVRTGRPLHAAEGGFALGLGANESTGQEWTVHAAGQWVGARSAHGGSAIVNLLGERRGAIVRADPNTNVSWARTVIPTLHADLPAGEHWLACAVVATSAIDLATHPSAATPSLAVTAHGFEIRDGQARLVFHEPTPGR